MQNFAFAAKGINNSVKTMPNNNFNHLVSLDCGIGGTCDVTDNVASTRYQSQSMKL